MVRNNRLVQQPVFRTPLESAAGICQRFHPPSLGRGYETVQDTREQAPNIPFSKQVPMHLARLNLRLGTIIQDFDRLVSMEADLVIPVPGLACLIPACDRSNNNVVPCDASSISRSQSSAG